MIKARINKIITWDNKEYAHIIEDEPSEFCDICTFRDLCMKVIQKKLAFEDSPMKKCEELCDAEDTHFAFFIDSSRAEDYCNRFNK